MVDIWLLKSASPFCSCSHAIGGELTPHQKEKWCLAVYSGAFSHHWCNFADGEGPAPAGPAPARVRSSARNAAMFPTKVVPIYLLIHSMLWNCQVGRNWSKWQELTLSCSDMLEPPEQRPSPVSSSLHRYRTLHPFNFEQWPFVLTVLFNVVEYVLFNWKVIKLVV